jgi:hypothetical protein
VRRLDLAAGTIVGNLPITPIAESHRNFARHARYGTIGPIPVLPLVRVALNSFVGTAGVTT